MADLVFHESARFFDVEGIPVAWDLHAAPPCARYDRTPPQGFDYDRLHREGNPITRAQFDRLCLTSRARS